MTTPARTVGELKKLLANMDDDTELVFRAMFGKRKSDAFRIEALELEAGEPPILELLGPRIEGSKP